MRNKVFFWGFILGMIFCTSGCQQSELANITEETNDLEQMQEWLKENEGEQVQEQLKEHDYYEKLIGVARECALNNNGEKPEGYDFSIVIYMNKNWDYGTLGYLIKDIDENGTDELIFGGNTNDPSLWYDGIIYDIYTISDGELVHVLDGWERSRYFLCENGMIAHEGDGGAFNGTNSYFMLEGYELKLVESVTWEYNPEKDANIYYYTQETECDTENAEIISPEQADAVKGKYVYEHTTFIPFKK